MRQLQVSHLECRGPARSRRSLGDFRVGVSCWCAVTSACLRWALRGSTLLRRVLAVADARAQYRLEFPNGSRNRYDCRSAMVRLARMQRALCSTEFVVRSATDFDQIAGSGAS